MERVVFLMTLLSCSISRGVTYFRFLHQQIINVIRLSFFFFNIKNCYLFIFGCAGSLLLWGSSLVAVASLVAERGLWGAWASGVAAGSGAVVSGL